jgi:hypothetical protein
VLNAEPYYSLDVNQLANQGITCKQFFLVRC